MAGIVATLEGTVEIKSLKLSIKGEGIEINLNGALVPVVPFVGKFIRTLLSVGLSTRGGRSDRQAGNQYHQVKHKELAVVGWHLP